MVSNYYIFMLDFNSILIFSQNPEELLNYYKQVFGKDPEWQGEVGDFSAFKVGAGVITIGPHDKVQGKSQNPERIMFNFETDDVQGEFDRIKSIPGTKVIAEPYHPDEDPQMWLATFADPDNNYFQLGSPMKI